MDQHVVADEAAGLALDEFLCFAVYSAAHAFNRLYRPLLDEIGLTYPQYLAMVALWTGDGQTVRNLGDRLFLESSTLTPMLKRLESLGYIVRQRSAADERQVLVRLTDSGRALRGKAAAIPSCVAEAIGGSPERLERLRKEVSTVRDHLLAQNPEGDAARG